MLLGGTAETLRTEQGRGKEIKVLNCRGECLFEKFVEERFVNSVLEFYISGLIPGADRSRRPLLLSPNLDRVFLASPVFAHLEVPIVSDT